VQAPLPPAPQLAARTAAPAATADGALSSVESCSDAAPSEGVGESRDPDARRVVAAAQGDENDGGAAFTTVAPSRRSAAARRQVALAGSTRAAAAAGPAVPRDVAPPTAAAVRAAADAESPRERRQPLQAPPQAGAMGSFMTIAEIRRQALDAAHRVLERGGSPVSARRASELAVRLKRELAARRLAQRGDARRAAAAAAAGVAAAAGHAA
jgi:hypothetical protein